jgi:hypothetical protein
VCGGGRLLDDRRTALGCAGTCISLPPAISPSLCNVVDLGAVPMDEITLVVASLSVLRRRPDLLAKWRGSVTLLRTGLAAESGHAAKNKTAGMWDDGSEFPFFVMYGAPLGHDGLSKRNQ